MKGLLSGKKAKITNLSHFTGEEIESQESGLSQSRAASLEQKHDYKLQPCCFASSAVCTSCSATPYIPFSPHSPANYQVTPNKETVVGQVVYTCQQLLLELCCPF